MKNIFIILIFVSTTHLFSQNVGINSTGAAPRNCAMLDILATDKGLLVPQVALTNVATYLPLTGTAVAGLLVYSTAAPTGGNGTGYYYWTGAVWANLIDNVAPGNPWYVGGNAGAAATTDYIGTSDNNNFRIKTNAISRAFYYNDGTYYHTSGSTTIDNATVVAPTNMSAGVGGAWIYNTAPAANGTGYGAPNANYGILAAMYGTRNYSSALLGQPGTGTRSAGVFGFDGSITNWGTLGYRTSGSTYFGAYFNAGSSTGTGFLTSNMRKGMGMGCYSDFVGAIVKADVIGQVNIGGLIASYNLGNEYTSGYKADIIDNGSKRTVVFSNTSSELKVYSDGTTQLKNGKVFISFDESFTNTIDKDKMPTITVSPMGECNGLYIMSIEKNGFWIKELNNGTSNANIAWIAIGKRVDQKNVDVPEQILEKTFDANLNKVVINENINSNTSGYMWWDGSKFVFDKPAPETKPLFEAKKPSVMLDEKR